MVSVICFIGVYFLIVIEYGILLFWNDLMVYDFMSNLWMVGYGSLVLLWMCWRCEWDVGFIGRGSGKFEDDFVWCNDVNLWCYIGLRRVRWIFIKEERLFFWCGVVIRDD